MPQHPDLVGSPGTPNCRPYKVEDRRRAPIPNVRIVDCNGLPICEMKGVAIRSRFGTWTVAEADAIDAKVLANANLICDLLNGPQPPDTVKGYDIDALVGRGVVAGEPTRLPELLKSAFSLGEWYENRRPAEEQPKYDGIYVSVHSLKKKPDGSDQSAIPNPQSANT
jgi:hypothetical protein